MKIIIYACAILIRATRGKGNGYVSNSRSIKVMDNRWAITIIIVVNYTAFFMCKGLHIETLHQREEDFLN